MVLYLCVLIVFSLRRESLKLILVTDPFLRWFCHNSATGLGSQYIWPSQLKQPGPPEHSNLCQKTGDHFPPSSAQLRQLILANRQWEAGQGGAIELGWNLRTRLVPVWRRGARRGGLPTVRKTAAEGRSSATRTRGGQSGTSGRWAAEDEEGARGTLHWARGWWGMAIDSGLREEDDGGEQWLPASLTGNSSCNRLPHEEE
jgi:hypothetical protein